MKVEIDKIKYKVKPATELTVKEYNKFFSTITGGTGSEYLICYLSVMTGLDFPKLANFNIDEKSFRRLIFFIGQLNQPKDIPESKEFLYRETNQFINRDDVNWRTLGVRKFLEEKKDLNQIEQAVYLLAVYIAKDYDSEKIEKIYLELQEYNAIDVLSFSVFFFKRLFDGQRLGMNFTRKLLKKVLTNTAKRLSK